MTANGDWRFTQCFCVHLATQCERCESQDAQDNIREELECRKSVQEAVREVFVYKNGGGGGYLLPKLPFTGTGLATRRQIDRRKLGKRQNEER